MAWLYKQKDSKNWWLGYRIHGRCRFRTTGTPDRAEAEKQLAQAEAMFGANKSGSLTQELFEALTGKTVPRKTLQAALDDWWAEAEGSAAGRTVERYRTIGEGFARFLGATSSGPLLGDVTTEHLRSYLANKRSGTSASTCNLERKILSVFFQSAVKNGLLKANPVQAVKPFKAGRGERTRKRAFTLDELRLLYDKAPDDFWRYLVLGGFYTSQRLGDLICLPWGAVDFTANVLRLTASKTDRALQIPLRPSFRALLWQLRAKAKVVNPADFIWPEPAARYQEHGAGQFSNEFYTRILVPCGLVPPRTHQAQKDKSGRSSHRKVLPISFHSLRHTHITLLKATGGTQAVAKELAGHSSDAISDLYTHLPLETLAEAIQQLPEVISAPPPARRRGTGKQARET